MQQVQVIVGLETHVQLRTRTKLFCGCPTTFGLPPNSATCPVCLGLPGALPVLNREAFALALRATLALTGSPARVTRWDRKCYFYPDLPKGYQISQYELPICQGGHLTLPSGKRASLIRAHLEEDAGKLTHQGDLTLIDLNRAGTPLLEVVSQPCLHSPEEAREYLEELALLMRQIGVSDCKMQEGSLRCDANVNLKVTLPDGSEARTPIVEVKNLNSFAFLEQAVRYEARRQLEQWRGDPGYVMGAHPKATAGWDERKGVTVFQRRKEEAADYRYFPDPDLVPVTVDDALLARARAEMGETPGETRARLAALGARKQEVEVLLGLGAEAIQYFDEAATASGDPAQAALWVTNQVLAAKKGEAWPVPPRQLGELLALQRERSLSKQAAQLAFARMTEGLDPREAVESLGLAAPLGEAEVRAMVRKAVAGNPRAVADFRAGKRAAANALKGAVMKEARGAVHPSEVDRILAEELAGPEAE